jgi:hypothetical protein
MMDGQNVVLGRHYGIVSISVSQILFLKLCNVTCLHIYIIVTGDFIVEMWRPLKFFIVYAHNKPGTRSHTSKRKFKGKWQSRLKRMTQPAQYQNISNDGLLRSESFDEEYNEQLHVQMMEVWDHPSYNGTEDNVQGQDLHQSLGDSGIH